MGSSPPVGPCLSTTQPQDHVKQSQHNTIYLSIIPSPAPEVTPSRLPVFQVSSGTFIPTHPVFQLLTCLQTAQLTEAHGISDPFVKNRHTFHQAFTDSCTAPRSSQKAFFLFLCNIIPPAFEWNLFGLPQGVNERHPAPDVST